MKTIKPSNNPHQWPRKAVKSIECRRRDLVLRITDWTRDKDEPAIDVEIYLAGVYDWDKSQSFLTRNAGQTKKQATEQAVAYVAKITRELL